MFSGTPKLACKAKMRRSAALGEGGVGSLNLQVYGAFPGTPRSTASRVASPETLPDIEGLAEPVDV